MSMPKLSMIYNLGVLNLLLLPNLYEYLVPELFKTWLRHSYGFIYNFIYTHYNYLYIINLKKSRSRLI